MSDVEEVVVVTARFLADGAPAYLTQAGTWTRSLQEANVLPLATGTEYASARAQTDQATVADPYVFKVEVRNAVIDALSTRERIRANGPSIRMRRPD
jgi:hypothetical protein